MNETPYTLENWFRPAAFEQCTYYSYDGLLTEVLGQGSVLVYLQEGDYEGDWTAVVTDGTRIGLVEGYYGSCSGCDAMEAAEGSPSDLRELAQDYLKSVRTFSQWEDLQTYLEYSKEEGLWSFKSSRDELKAFADVQMPLGARDILQRLQLDDSQLGLVQAAEMAKALHEG